MGIRTAHVAVATAKRKRVKPKPASRPPAQRCLECDAVELTARERLRARGLCEACYQVIIDSPRWREATGQQKISPVPWEHDALARAFVEAHPEGASLTEVGNVYGVSKERARQIQEAALAKLRRNGGAKILAEYLASKRAAHDWGYEPARGVTPAGIEEMGTDD